MGEPREVVTNRVAIVNVEFREVDTEPDSLLYVVVKREDFIGFEYVHRQMGAFPS